MATRAVPGGRVIISLEGMKVKKVTENRSQMTFSWSHLGLNQGLPDYESGALTN